jgi:hypothetical protein
MSGNSDCSTGLPNDPEFRLWFRSEAELEWITSSAKNARISKAVRVVQADNRAASQARAGALRVRCQPGPPADGELQLQGLEGGLACEADAQDAALHQLSSGISYPNSRQSWRVTSPSLCGGGLFFHAVASEGSTRS